jgi:hypothetical protein
MNISFNRWQRLWDGSGPPLTRGGADQNVPPLNFGPSLDDGECGLSNDGTRIVFPLFLGLYPATFDVAFEKMAAFIVKIKQVTRISAVARHRPVSWDVNGFKAECVTIIQQLLLPIRVLTLHLLHKPQQP